MTSNLNWITPQGSIASILINVPIVIDVLAANSVNPGATLKYQIIGGSLPPGMTMSSAGIISGTPTYESLTDNNATSYTYSFVVRASSDGSTPIDRSFSIFVNNTVNSDFAWVTPAGNLGTLPNGEFFQLQLVVEETLPNTTVTFSTISGELPPGMQLTKSGVLQGVPTLVNAVAVDSSESFRFTIRATNSLGRVRDQAFTLSVTNVYGPVISPSTVDLGSAFDSTYYSLQLNVTELNPNVSIQWSNIGPLPPGLSISSTGTLSGYIQPALLVGAFGPPFYDGDEASEGSSGAIIQNAEYDEAPYDFNEQSQTTNYSFTVQAFDGANYAQQKYILNVVSRTGFSTDNSNVTVDNTYITVDNNNIANPVILNGNVLTLPAGRAGSYYSYKFEGYDFQGSSLTYTLVNTAGSFDATLTGVDDGFDYNGNDNTHLTGVGFDSATNSTAAINNLPGLALDGQTGWLYGKLNPQGTAYQLYEFGVIVSKTANNVVYSSNPIFFSLPVLGDINNIIAWSTPSDLGTIDNGAVSELVVSAYNNEGGELVYSLVDQAGVPIRLPQGLTLLPSGKISGRVSFEVFSLDAVANDYNRNTPSATFTGTPTTFDGETTTIDRKYTFTVEASTTDGQISSTKEFTVTVSVIDNKPYENLYLRPMLSVSQRQTLNNVTSSTEIFPTNDIYRADDPWFGVTNDWEMLFLPGLNPTTLNTYANLIAENHYTKTYNFGSIDTAVVLDENYNVKYEVVYINVNDPELNSSGNGPGEVLNLSSLIKNPYIDADGNTFDIIYPNTSQDMTDRLLGDVYDSSSLPEWMTSNQPDPTNPGKFTTPLGFTRAIVIAYTQPGKSNLIAYRLKNSGINFNNIGFTVDRYLLDDYYSTNFDIADDDYYTGRETTFDALPTKNIGSIVGSVNYALTTPFDQINGRSIEYILDNGGLDGITNFNAGDTLIFVNQENIPNSGPYNGWVYYEDGYIGDNILTPQEEGYDSEPFDEYTIVPGYLEKMQEVLPTGSTTVTAMLVVNGVNYLTVNSTAGMAVGGSIVFTGVPFSNIVPGVTYNITGIISATNQITINNIVNSSSYVTQSYLVTNNSTSVFNTTDTIIALNPSTSLLNSITVTVTTNNVTTTLSSNQILSVNSSTVVLANPVAIGSTVTISFYTNIVASSIVSGTGSMAATVYVNQRGGIWQVEIIDDIVNLVSIQEITPGQRLQIVAGKTYGGAILYYNQNLGPGQTVPFYSVFNYQLTGNPVVRTTFNGDSTKFFSYRDSYYTPGSQDKYVKFPQYGAFN